MTPERGATQSAVPAGVEPAQDRRSVRRRRWRTIALLAAVTVLGSAALTGHGCIDGWVLHPHRGPVDPDGAARVVVPVSG
ncbi:MAG TPA: hypothetical protein VF796_03460, partial [Humisphaera sp.]